jgi:hypothetical protein
MKSNEAEHPRGRADARFILNTANTFRNLIKALGNATLKVWGLPVTI